MQIEQLRHRPCRRPLHQSTPQLLIGTGRPQPRVAPRSGIQRLSPARQSVATRCNESRRDRSGPSSAHRLEKRCRFPGDRLRRPRATPRSRAAPCFEPTRLADQPVIDKERDRLVVQFLKQIATNRPSSLIRFAAGRCDLQKHASPVARSTTSPFVVSTKRSAMHSMRSLPQWKAVCKKPALSKRAIR